MAKDFFREENGPAYAVGSRGSIRQAILLVLLLITAGLGYLYFFTGMIRPREHITITPPPSVTPVKQPLPPRLAQEAVEQAATAAKEEKKGPAPETETKSPATPPPGGPKETVVPATKPEAPQAAKPAAHPAIKPATAAAAKKAASPAQKPTPPQIKPQSGKAVKTGEKPAVKAETKAQSVSPPQAAKSAKGSGIKPAGASAAKDSKPEQAAIQGKYALLIGGLAGSGEAEKMRTRLLKQGITDISVRQVKKTETMHRIFLGEFNSQAAANAEFNKLKTQAVGAFVLRESGGYLLYAGSYLHEGKAREELKRLEGKGLKPDLKIAKVSITVNEVLAGSFPDSGEAKKEADRLKKKGIDSSVIKSGR